MRSLVPQTGTGQHECVLNSAGQDWQNGFLIAQHALQVWVLFDVANTDTAFPVGKQFDLVVLNTIERNERRLFETIAFFLGNKPALDNKVYKAVVVLFVHRLGSINALLSFGVCRQCSLVFKVLSFSRRRIRRQQTCPAVRRSIRTISSHLYGQYALSIGTQSGFRSIFQMFSHLNKVSAA